MSATAMAMGTETGTDVIMGRLEDQEKWYDRKSTANQKAYRRIKATEIIAAALIPLLAGININSTNTMSYVHWITAGLGVLITALEGILQLNNYQQNWTNYRATAEALKHEKFLYLAGASAYATASNPRAMLAERVESLLSQENLKWVTVQQQTPKNKQDQQNAS